MFNYFSELKKHFKIPDKFFNSYNIVNVGGNLVYIEGQKGLLTLRDDVVSFKLKTCVVEIKGMGLKLRDLGPDTVAVQGKIYKIEVF